MTQLSDILDTDLLRMHVEDGYVRMQVHPESPFRIFNYTDRATWDRQWDDVTTVCRGLIVDGSDQVLARPFRKFWNLGEHETGLLPSVPWQEKFRAFDKVDGSLGILYREGPGRYAIATRGSFTSDQAVHATEVWKNRYQKNPAVINPDWTLLFEIVYPDNRIVVDYDDMDDLVLLGAVRIVDGYTITPDLARSLFGWRGPIAERHEATGLGDLPDHRDNKEGFVLWFDSGFKVKIKHEAYLNLHRLVTGLTQKSVWRIAFTGDYESMNAIPEEFREHVDAYWGQLWDAYGDIWQTVRARFRALKAAHLAPGRETAEWVKENAANPLERSILFCWINDKGDKVDDLIWRSLEPKGAVPLWNAG